MAELPSLLLASLRPDSRKQAEQSLHALSLQPGFLTHLLSLVLQSAQDRAVRLAGSVYLKNLVKSLKSKQPDAVLEAFPTDTEPDNLRKTFADIKAHKSFEGLKLRLAIFSIKNSTKKPFLTETYEEFMAPLAAYVGGECRISEASGQ